MYELGMLLLVVAVAIGAGTCAVIDHVGAWDAYEACVAHHPVAECQALHPEFRKSKP